MSPFVLLAGIAVAACVFAATIWSAAQIYRQSGQLRTAHLMCLLLTLAGMGALQLQWPLGAAITGALLGLSACAAIILERGANRLLPVFQLIFGAALAFDLPFTAG